MPMYVYAVVLPDGSEGESFEVLQSMSEPSLIRHPDTGEPVRRLLSVCVPQGTTTADPSDAWRGKRDSVP